MTDLFETTRTIKAISLWQPWASLVAAHVKRHETRHWSTDYRGPIAIHAARTLDIPGAPDGLCQAALGRNWARTVPIGMVVAGITDTRGLGAGGELADEAARREIAGLKVRARQSADRRLAAHRDLGRAVDAGARRRKAIHHPGAAARPVRARSAPMSRPSKGARLYLRRNQRDRRTGWPLPDVWVIRDGKTEVSTGFGADGLPGAERALADHIASGRGRSRRPGCSASGERKARCLGHPASPRS